MVLPPNELPDHCKIVTELEEILVSDEEIKNNYKWTHLKKKSTNGIIN